MPSVSLLLETLELQKLSKRFGGEILKSELRLLLEELRNKIKNGKSCGIPEINKITEQLETRLTRFTSPEGRRAINATGILLHTGLGRSPLCSEALEALAGMGTYSLLQADLASGKRSLREEKIERMLIRLTGCEAATVVNNNAAATMLILNTLAAGKKVILSRGQLIEIGGEFRMPDVMARSSVIMQEIGTTNRTHLKDYEKAIDENTGALLHVHTSNFRVRGFSGTPDIKELCSLAKKYNLPVIDDLGSGALVPLSRYGITDEPLVSDSIKAGSSVICFSGDKLINGPQAGIICGKKEFIQNIRKNPFARMFRVCKLTLAALEATLVHFVNDTQGEALPFYKMLTISAQNLEKKAKLLADLAGKIKGVKAKIIDDVSYVGSGSLPDEGIPTKVVCVSFDNANKSKKSIEEIAICLRLGVPSVFCRVKDDALYFDMRTLFDKEEREIAEALSSVMKGCS
ncbi:MAG: L-seryl-tRNA(Sec) selenium transferase [Candidatus Firestonebacteria bacterium]|nr:L-seryl-tRNA(Sec) selenium transferase [Candidatus Firestonebacteria bacterium]